LERTYAQEQQQQLAPLSDDDQVLIRQALTDLPHLWHAETTTAAERKRLLRCLIRDVSLDAVSQPGMTLVHVRWQTGASTTLQVRRPRASDYLTTDAKVLAQMRQLAVDHSDDQIADVLNTQQLKTRLGLDWTYRRVHAVRLRNHIPSGCPIVPVCDAARGDGLLPVRTASQLLHVSAAAIDWWARHGILQSQQMPGKNPLWVRVSPADVQRLTAEQPEPGYLRLRTAARLLGLDQTHLWDEVKSGQRAIRRMRRAKHWEWQVQVSPPASQTDSQNKAFAA
jgi:hypothetical protein